MSERHIDQCGYSPTGFAWWVKGDHPIAHCTCDPAPAPYKLCVACGDEPAVGEGSKHPDHCAECGAQQ